jgi:hypothetical protein
MLVARELHSGVMSGATEAATRAGSPDASCPRLSRRSRHPITKSDHGIY